MLDCSVSLAGISLQNPLIAASGCYGFGREYQDLYPLSIWGGVSLKGTTLHPKAGNPAPRVAETPCGMLNSVGLENPGIHAVVEEVLPRLKDHLQKKGIRPPVLIANIAGPTVEQMCQAVEIACRSPLISMIELNISCPNVKEGGVAFGVTCQGAGEVTRQVRRVCTKPLMVKLSPNVADIAAIAQAVEAEGADAVSLINTLLGMRIDIRTRRPVLRNNVGGLSGPAVFPVALRMVWLTAQAVKIPIVGIGGVSRWEDVVEMMLAGASSVQMGAALFSDPMAPVKTLAGLKIWMEENGVTAISQIVGQVAPW